MIDPVELKALVEKLESQDWSPKDGALARDPVFLCHEAGDALLALSDEVERLGQLLDGAETNCEDLLLERSANRKRATAAESEAQALRERMGEIREIAITRRTFTDRAKYADVLEAAMRRIAALSTTPTKDPAP